jgi:hypothetical protein
MNETLKEPEPVDPYRVYLRAYILARVGRAPPDNCGITELVAAALGVSTDDGDPMTRDQLNEAMSEYLEDGGSERPMEQVPADTSAHAVLVSPETIRTLAGKGGIFVTFVARGSAAMGSVLRHAELVESRIEAGPGGTFVFSRAD